MCSALPLVAGLCLLLLSPVPGFPAGALSNRRAPSFNLPDGRLQRYDIQDYRGRVLLLEFLSTTCPSCAQLSRTLAQVQQRYGTRIQVLGVVTYPPENQDTVLKFIQEHKPNYPILFDCSQTTAAYLNISPKNPKYEVPHLFVIDGSGRIRNDFGHHDVEQLDAAALGKYLDTLLPPAPAPAAKKP